MKASAQIRMTASCNCNRTTTEAAISSCMVRRLFHSDQGGKSHVYMHTLVVYYPTCSVVAIHIYLSISTHPLSGISVIHIVCHLCYNQALKPVHTLMHGHGHGHGHGHIYLDSELYLTSKRTQPALYISLYK